MHGYLVYHGPIENYAYCPWNEGQYSDKRYGSDCVWDKKSCVLNLKFTGPCLGNVFNRVHQQFCRLSTAKASHEKLINNLMMLGHTFEKNHAITCNASVRNIFGTRGRETVITEETFDSIKGKTDIQFIKNKHKYQWTQNTRSIIRDSPSCVPGAGVIGCKKVRFHKIETAQEYIKTVSN